ncbi:arginase family protein [Saprospiraceae bacterium]|nr:arginase family protein [Saprospiraceae bacterium]
MLENWLKKVNPEITSQISQLNTKTVAYAIKIHKQLFPDLDDCQIVLLSDNASQMDEIRKQFYEMYNHFENIGIADIGDLRNSDSNFLISLFTELLESKVLPIIITSDPNIIHTYHFALNAFHAGFTSLHCGKRIAAYHANDHANCNEVISMGTQGHFNSATELDNNQVVRMAEIKGSIEEAEPYTRTVDTITFDLNIIRHSEIPGFQDASPSGLDSDETTQLFRYFGFNDQLKGLFICNYDHQYDFNNMTSQMIAQLIWYFVEAKNECVKENIDSTEDFHEFLVDIEGLGDPIAFIKAKKSGRWWIKSNTHNDLIPCSYKDYLTACKNEIPDKLLL